MVYLLMGKTLRKELIPLTSLRGLAAMAVIAMHYSATMQEIAIAKFPSLAPHGSLAVDVFFVLSGFIMGYTYRASFEREDTASAYRKFLLKRAGRILPLNAAISIALVLVGLASLELFGSNTVPTVRPDHVLIDLVSNLFLLPGIGIGHSLNWPAWSISVEFVAYFVFPILLAAIFNKSRLLLVVSCLLAVVGMWASVGPNFGISGMHNHPWPWRDILRCVCEFGLGLAAYRAFSSGRFTKVFSKDAVALSILASVLLIVLLNLGELFAMLLFPALILALSLNSGWVARILSIRPLHFLGEISFSLYLVTDPFRQPLQHLVKYLHPTPLLPHQGMAMAAICAIAMILPAWVTFNLVEKPGRSAMRHMLASGTSNTAGRVSPTEVR